MRRLSNEPMNPGDDTAFRFRARDERVASDEHAQAERNELHSGGRGRRLASDQIKEAGGFFFGEPEE